MSIYSELVDMGYTPDEIADAVNERPSARQFTLAIADNGESGEDPIVGITYACDYRAEEEWGVGDLYKALLGDDYAKGGYVMQKSARDHIGKFTGVTDTTLILSVSKIVGSPAWGTNIWSGTGPYDYSARGQLDTKEPSKWDDTYDNHWTNSLAHAQGLDDYSYRYKNLKELRTLAIESGVEKLPRTKAALVAAITATQIARTPNTFPAWFHNGDTIVFRANGLVGEVLGMLYDAALDGDLAMGGGSQIFGSGTAFYDSKDVSKSLKKQRAAHQKWLDAETKKLEPVKKELTKRGIGWYALGKPTNGFKSLVGQADEDVTPDTTFYWLNGHGMDVGEGVHAQPYGWYTREQLLDEKFKTDALERKRAGR
jgi:hypothetical protein